MFTVQMVDYNWYNEEEYRLFMWRKYKKENKTDLCFQVLQLLVSTRNWKSLGRWRLLPPLPWDLSCSMISPAPQVCTIWAVTTPFLFIFPQWTRICLNIHMFHNFARPNTEALNFLWKGIKKFVHLCVPLNCCNREVKSILCITVLWTILTRYMEINY